MNYFFVTLSQLYGNPESLSEFVYNIDNSDKTYKGKLANDAPLKYVQEKLALNKEIIDKYIIVATAECKAIIKDTNISTIDYYKQQVLEHMNYLCTQYKEMNDIIKNKGFNDLQDYVDKTIIVVDNDSQLNSKIFELFDENDDEKKKIFMDISGGSRELPMQLSLILYYLGYKNSTVEDLIYASKSNTEEGFVTKINSFTDSWKKIIRSIEDEEGKKSYVAKTKHEEAITGKKKSKEYHEAVKELDNTTDSLGKVVTNKAVQQSVKKAEAKANELKKSNDVEVQKLAKKINKEVKQTKSVDSLDKLMNKDDDTLINEFYEKIIEIFEGKGVFKNNKKNDKSDEYITAINKYYFNQNDKGWLKNCVCKVVKDMCEELKRYDTVTPKQYYQEILDINNFSRYPMNAVGKYGKYSNQGANYNMSIALLNKIEQKEIKILHDNGSQMIKDYLKLQYFYYSYGFPFACRFKDGVYPEVQKYYLDKFKELVDRLEKVRVTNKGEYNNLLKKYSKNPKAAIDKMPEEGQIVVNKEKFNDPNFADKFMERLANQRVKVASFRNKLAHDKENTTIADLSPMANEIRAWLKTYKNKLK